MLEDVPFAEAGAGAPLRAELDAFALAQIAHARRSCEQPRALVGLLFGDCDARVVRVRAAAVLGAARDVRALDEAARLEPFVRHFERARGGALVGWFAAGEEGFELLHQRLGRFRAAAFVFLRAEWAERAGQFELSVLAPAANRRFRQLFSAFVRVPHSVVARQLPHPNLWALLGGADAREGAPDPAVAARVAAFVPGGVDARLRERLRGAEEGLAAAERLFARAAAVGAAE